MIERLRKEPVMITAVLVAIVNLVVGLGYLSQSEGDTIVSLLESLVVLILGFVARDRVSPVK